jgi:twinkle protein
VLNDVQAFVSALHVDDTDRFACPSCSPQRRKQNLKELVVTRKTDAWVFHCHHCGVNGSVPFEKRNYVERKLSVVPKPITAPVNALEEAHYAFLNKRGISRETADKTKLFAAEKWFQRIGRNAPAVGFPYFRNGAMTAAKYRCIEDKDFTQDTGGAQDFFGIDRVDPSKPIVIVEGEIDALSGLEAGVENVVSVPSGAPMKVVDGKVTASEDKKFAFVWNAFELLSKAPFIVIATDNDSPGQALAEELARRIGKHKCRLTKFDRKDLNEVLLNDGSDAVRSIIDAAEPYPVEGLSSATKFSERVNDLWSKGTGKGVSTGYSSLDQIYTVAPGQLTVVTGYPSNGKSNFVDQLMVNLARQHDWKFAVCSFENQPEVHITRFMEIYSGKRFFEGSNRMTDEEKDAAFKWVTDHFLFMDSETVEPATIESILDRAQAAVARMGIRGLCIDPYNYIDMKNRGDSETGAISDLLTRVQAFAKAFGVHVWFVAHPSKVSRTGVDLPRPDGMSIAGSMAWWAKADCGLTVHRAEIGVEVAVWKCRYRWVGTQGEVLLGYDKVTGTYNEQVDVF